MLAVSRVTFAYRGQRALDDVTFDVGPGQLVAIAGQNGSGKSTLLKILARVFMPPAGTVTFDGRSVRDWPAKEYARHVGYLPQEPDETFAMRAIDVVVSGRAPFLTRFGWESASDYAAADEALQLCDGRHLRDRFLDEMSGGERKRVFLARVLAGKPRLILLDEPLAALDVAHVQQFSKLLREIVDRTGATVLFASHDLNWAAAFSDRMIVLRAGVVEADGTPAAIMRPEVIGSLFGFDAATAEVGGRRWLVPNA
jgi:ferric hydroxamate transport system ATP-binding protein